jgi:KEOPS complex subunit Cgi121
LISAFEHAKRSIQREENATHSIGMEILLYASGERQIKKAIKKMGIKKERNSFVAIFIHSSEINNKIDLFINEFLTHFHLEKNDSVIIPDTTMLLEYGISKQAILSVNKDQVFQLVLEKIALVDVIKK